MCDVLRERDPPTSRTSSSGNDSGMEDTNVGVTSEGEGDFSRTLPAFLVAGGDRGNQGDLVLPTSALMAKKRSNKEKGAERMVEMADANAKERLEAGSACMLSASSDAEYQKKRVLMMEQFLILTK